MNLFFFSSRRRHTRYWRDWSSDVCSSDLRLVVMGGSAARGGNVTAAAEFNIWADAEAAQRVLTAGLPTVLVGLDVTLPTVLTASGIDRFRAAGPVGATAAAVLRSEEHTSEL